MFHGHDIIKNMKTIATISTPLGNGAIGIIRMSGDKSLEIASKLFSTKKLNSFKEAKPNYMYYGTLSTDTINDTILAVYFKAPVSYTGEDIVEFQCHGGVRILEEILKGCLKYGAVTADKGEFTKRAFLNGKISLSDAEGIIDMINAESIAAINVSYRLAKGNLSETLNNIQSKILDCVSQLEASLDYPDEMEDESKINCKEVLNENIDSLKVLLNTENVGGYIKKGINVAIVGQANVGKSSLLNGLLGKQRAIVTDIAGTTRDSIEESIEVNGILLNLIDTAGIRETKDIVESLGVERSLEAAKSADVVIFISECGRDYNNEELSIKEKLEKDNKKVVYVFNKNDLNKPTKNQEKEITISAKNNIGIDELKTKIVNMFITENIDSSSSIITNQRHLDAIKEAVESIENVLNTIDKEPVECVLIDLRKAYFALGEVTGNCASEDIIDKIFSKFCLGK